MCTLAVCACSLLQFTWNFSFCNFSGKGTKVISIDKPNNKKINRETLAGTEKSGVFCLIEEVFCNLSFECKDNEAKHFTYSSLVRPMHLM